tara:strand:+ start:806 stop:1108 length:303 start_codon:yes stop_codon:yes gene_type:complete
MSTELHACGVFDVLCRHFSQAQNPGSIGSAINNRGFDTDRTRTCVEDDVIVGEPVTDFFYRVLRGCRADSSESVGTRGGDCRERVVAKRAQLLQDITHDG